jgi:hypothetical protein
MKSCGNTIRVTLALASVSVFLAGGCAMRMAAVKPGFEIKTIRTVALGQFTGTGQYQGSGDTVRDEFARQLLKSGFVVKRAGENADAVLSATVTQYSPERRFLFYTPQSQSQAQQQTQINLVQPLEIGGSNVYSLGSAMGVNSDESKILVSNASAGVSASLIDPAKGEILWSDSFSYEGFDIQWAVESVVNRLVKSLITGK